MTGEKATNRSPKLHLAPRLHLAMMVSFCAALAGCETTGEQASVSPKSQRQVSGRPQLAPPGNAVAQVDLPDTPPDTLYPVTVALEPAVDPVLAAEAVDPSLVPGSVPVPRPSPTTALAMAAPAPGAEAETGVAGPAAGGPAVEMQTAAATALPASPLAARGARPGAPVVVASAAGIPASVMMAEDVAPQAAVPSPRPVPALGYAAPGAQTAALAAIGGNASAAAARMGPAGADRNRIDDLISRYSSQYGVPEKLVHRVVHRESRYDPKAFNRNGYFGLMQIAYPTARSMGYQGPASGLFDAETNLKYAVKYLRGAYLVADTDHDHAVRLYARGYYYDAKRKGMLDVLK